MAATEPAAPAAPPAPAATATNAELVRWAFDVLNTHDATPLKEFWTADTVERFPMRTARGANEIAAVFEGTFAALPDLRIEIVELVEQGENVFARWHLTGTHTGAPWEGIAPTGKRVELDGIDHFVVRDGRVISNFVVFDQLQFARAVGLLPENGTPADRALKGAFGLQAKLAQAVRSKTSRK
jgi:predicted ester cyclase